MKLEFNTLGVLINTENTSIRQGSKGNEIVAEFDGFSNLNHVAKINISRPDGSHIDNIVMNPIPSIQNSFKLKLNDVWYSAISGTASLTIYLYDGNGNIVANGQVNFDIEESDYYEEQGTITEEQYNSLLSTIASIQSSLKEYNDNGNIVNLTSNQQSITDQEYEILSHKNSKIIVDGNTFYYRALENSLDLLDSPIFFYNIVPIVETTDGYQKISYQKIQVNRNKNVIFSLQTIIEAYDKSQAEEKFYSKSQADIRFAKNDGQLPSYSVNRTDNVINFLTTNNLTNTIPIILKINSDVYFATFYYMWMGIILNFELERCGGSNPAIRYRGQITNNPSVAFNDLIASRYLENYELEKNKSQSITISETQYPSSKAVYYALAQKQNRLVSGTNIKTINNISLLGSGNIDIQGGSGNAEWGSIGGDIADQTDLQDEFQEVREIATGRTRSAIISYLKEAPTEQTFSQIPYYDLRGNRIATWSEFVAFVNGRTFANSKFNSQNDDIEIDYDEYIIFAYHTRQTVYRGDEAYEVDTANDCLNEGDIIIVKETNDQQGETIPDRWVYISDQTLVCSKLETSKVNLDNYSTKSETSTEVNKVAHDIAVEYDENTLYGVGDLCIKDKLLYKCNTNNTTGTWDSSKWDLTTVNSELGIIKGNYVDLTSAQTITGNKTFNSVVSINIANTTTHLNADGNNKCEIGQANNSIRFYDNNIRFVSPTLRPQTNKTTDLGTYNSAWRNLYLAGVISDGTNSVSMSDLVALIAYAKAQGWIS